MKTLFSKSLSRVINSTASHVVVVALLLPNAVSAQAPTQAATSALNGINSAIASMLSATQMANGIQNQQNGQSTQNMAQMAMGAMQILSALLGMLAAAGMGQNGNKAGNNASGMSGLGGDTAAYPGSYAGTSPTGSNPNNSGTNTVGTSSTGDNTGTPGATVGISASDLRTGTLGTAMTALQNNYGLNPDNVLNALKNGVDPKDILANAPKNAPSMDTLNKISEGLLASNAAGQDAAKAIAAANLANVGVNAGGASAAGTPTGDSTADAVKAGGPRSPASVVAPDDMEDANVSPEVRSALAAKAAQAAAQVKTAQDMQDMRGWNIFQLVHNRYQKLETMLYGRVERTNANPTSGVKGF